MNLKLSRLANNQPEVVVSVCYGGNDDGVGSKRFTSTIKLGQSVEVTDEIGQAILAAYSKHFDIVGTAPTSARKIATENDGHVITSQQNADAEHAIDNEIKNVKSKKTKDLQGASAAV